jgi:membrane protein DedA with SNARE-associated domain
VFEAVAPVLDHYGYLAVGALLFLEDFGVPVPGETILIAAAIYAGAGRLSIVGVITVGIIAAVLGDNVGYLIGRKAGRPAVLRWGKYILITDERLAKVESFFTRFGARIVTVARFIEGLRQANGIVAGLVEMPWTTFITYNVLGAVLWVGTWSALGYFAGNHITTIYETAQRYSLYVGLAIVLVLAGLLVRAVLRRRHSADDHSPTA